MVSFTRSTSVATYQIIEPLHQNHITIEDKEGKATHQRSIAPPNLLLQEFQLMLLDLQLPHQRLPFGPDLSVALFLLFDSLEVLIGIL